ncbi:MAG: glycosyltransferase family 4 protein [Deltaproteobacteria bacterium]|nr:glycosyltransferase family 4 protein [Deltaproteobacteria bacterium]
MRILVVMESLGLGGAELSLLYQLPALARLGYECHVAALRSPYIVSAHLEAVGVRVHRLDVEDRHNLPLAAFRLAQLCRRERIELAHAKLFHPSLALALGRVFGPDIPRVVSFHNLAYAYPLHPLRRELTRLVEGALLRHNIDGFAALSHAVASSFEEALGVRGVRVVPNAVPTPSAPWTPEARQEARRSLGLPAETAVLAMPARLVPEKGHSVFLDALMALKADGVPFYAVLAGAGPERMNIRAQIERLGFLEELRFIDQGLSHDDVLRLMAASDVVVVPSILEGFGLAPAEAMSVGAAVVASAAGGLVDLVEHERSGLLVPPSDPAALAAALRRLIKDPGLRQQLARAGFERVKTHFSPERVAELWDDLYRAVSR